MPYKTKRSATRVFLVDDHALVRRQLRALIEAEPDLTVCGDAADATTAAGLIRQQEAQLVVLDISLKRSNGLDLLKDLQTLQPRPVVLVLSMHDETFYVERALNAGAMGYITKEEAPFHFLSAVRRVLSGQVYLGERIADRLEQKRAGTGAVEVGSPLEVLTEREWRVFQAIGQGSGTAQIARELGLGVKTVEAYAAQIRDKLQLTDGEHLTRYATYGAQRNAIQPARSESRTDGGGSALTTAPAEVEASRPQRQPSSASVTHESP